MANILVVSSDAPSLGQMLYVLSGAGHQMSSASSFQQAREQLIDRSPDLVIADERLGEFNGLHVIISARANHPRISGIVTTPVMNRALEADAKSLNVECLVTPRDPGGWAASISRTLGAEVAH
jgi:DNA-binding NtrC family response regulator